MAGAAFVELLVIDCPGICAANIPLLKYFKNYLMEHLERGKDEDDAADDKTKRSEMKEERGAVVAPASGAAAAGAEGDCVYVKKWLRTKHAIIFRLSDKTVQVNFFDHTKIILSPRPSW